MDYRISDKTVKRMVGAVAERRAPGAVMLPCLAGESQFTAQLKMVAPDVTILPWIPEFLESKPKQLADTILLAPPMHRNGLDVALVRHAHKFLRPGGQMAAILSAEATFSQFIWARDYRVWRDTVKAVYFCEATLTPPCGASVEVFR